MTEIIVESMIKPVAAQDHYLQCGDDIVVEREQESEQSTGELTTTSGGEQVVAEESNHISVLSSDAAGGSGGQGDRVNSTYRQNGAPHNMCINVEEFLRMQLQNAPRDRSFMLNVEEELLNFLMTPSRENYKFDPMNPYYRMLVHRISEYFSLGHQVDQAKLCVIVTKTDKSKIPEISFREMIKSFESLTEPDAQNDNNQSPNVDLSNNGDVSQIEKKLSSSSLTDQQSESGTKKQILKREINNGFQEGGELSKNGFGKKAPEVKTKTFEEKSAEYIRAKNRIFNTQPSTASHNNYDPTRMTVLNRQNENGSQYRSNLNGGGYNKQQSMFNNKTRQNGGGTYNNSTSRPFNSQTNNVAPFRRSSPQSNGHAATSATGASSVTAAATAAAAATTNVSMVLNMSYLQQFPVPGGQFSSYPPPPLPQAMLHHPQYMMPHQQQQSSIMANQQPPHMIYNANGMTVPGGQPPYKLMQHLNMPPSMAQFHQASLNNGAQQSMMPPPSLEGGLPYGYPTVPQNILNSQYMNSSDPKSSINQNPTHLYYAMYANQLAASAGQQPLPQHHQVFSSQMKQQQPSSLVGSYTAPNGGNGGIDPSTTIMDSYHGYYTPILANNNPISASSNPASLASTSTIPLQMINESVNGTSNGGTSNNLINHQYMINAQNGGGNLMANSYAASTYAAQHNGMAQHMPPPHQMTPTMQYNGNVVSHHHQQFIQAGGQQPQQHQSQPLLAAPQPASSSSTSSNGSSSAYLPPTTTSSHNITTSSSYRNSTQSRSSNNNSSSYSYRNGGSNSIGHKQMPRSTTHSFNHSSSYTSSYNAQRGVAGVGGSHNNTTPRFSSRQNRNYTNGAAYSTGPPHSQIVESIKSANGNGSGVGASYTVQLLDIKYDLSSKSALSDLLGPYALSIDFKLKNSNINEEATTSDLINQELVDVFVSFQSEEKLREALSSGFNMSEQLYQTMLLEQQSFNRQSDDQLPFRIKSLTIE